MDRLDFHFDPLNQPIALSDLSDLGLSMLVIGLALALAIIAFRAGYLFGHQAGWKEGLKRGREFQRWKELEQGWEKNNEFRH